LWGDGVCNKTWRTCGGIVYEMDIDEVFSGELGLNAFIRSR
jgi:hypothetical protein